MVLSNEEAVSNNENMGLRKGKEKKGQEADSAQYSTIIHVLEKRCNNN
jgi:hypothetical protein